VRLRRLRATPDASRDEMREATAERWRRHPALALAAVVDEHVTTAPVEQAELPPFTNMRAGCPRAAGVV